MKGVFTQPTKPSEIPKGEHWAIIGYKTDSVHIPGDERSRQAPGHGYPERTDTFTSLTYQAFNDEATFTEELQHRLSRNENVKGIHVKNTYTGVKMTQLELIREV